MKEVQDRYFRLAKERGYRARSAFKLIEIDERFRLLRKGLRILDVGAAPGSWTQVAAASVGPSGSVIAIDLKPIDPRGLPPQVTIVTDDLTAIDPERYAQGGFDLIISDMAPDTTGVPSGDSAVSVRLCNELLDRSARWLRSGGDLVMKVYEGGEYPALLQRCRRSFPTVKGFKPASSRAESVEMFVVCRGYRPTGSSTKRDRSETPQAS